MRSNKLYICIYIIMLYTLTKYSVNQISKLIYIFQDILEYKFTNYK